jgi:hypothetical protein
MNVTQRCPSRLNICRCCAATENKKLLPLPRRAATVMKNKLPLPPPRVRRGSGSAATDVSDVTYVYDLVGFIFSFSLSQIIIRYFIPRILFTIGFGPFGVIAGTIAAWIQSKYGIFYFFSLLQSIGVLNLTLWSFISGSIFTFLKPWT